MRLNKFISDSGLCSRREADKLIERGHVFLNGRRAAVGVAVLPRDKVLVHGNLIEPRQAEAHTYILLNKPVGVESTTEPGVKNNIVEYVHHSQRIFPIGRLDKDSQGLILLTSDGDMVNKVLRAGNKHKKEYLVTVDRPITDEFITGMSTGVPMLGVVTKKCSVVKEAGTIFKITLIQGLNRQIRRMAEHFGYEVLKLERTKIMHLSSKGLPTGDWRELTEEELTELFRLTEKSEGVAPTKDKFVAKALAKPAVPQGLEPKGDNWLPPLRMGAKPGRPADRPAASAKSKAGANRGAGAGAGGGAKASARPSTIKPAAKPGQRKSSAKSGNKPTIARGGRSGGRTR